MGHYASNPTDLPVFRGQSRRPALVFEYHIRAIFGAVQEGVSSAAQNPRKSDLMSQQGARTGK
jgi:hypothetical protein